MRHHRVTRRDFLATGALAGAGLFVAPGLLTRGGARGLVESQAAHRGWAEADAILARISPPSFPDRVFPVTQYGAAGDGVRDCTAAFREAIAACAAAGGGRVLVPDGRYLSGAIHLKSGVNLHLSDSATIAFSRNPDHFLPVVFTRWEGVELMNYSALIYAFEQRDIAITGKAPSTARRVTSTGGRGRDPGPCRPKRRKWRLGRGSSTWARAACRWRSVCSGPGRSCGRTSSSRTAARTC
jgi:hypothetical protein